MLLWILPKKFLVIFIVLFFLIGVSAVSYTATSYLLLGFVSSWLIKQVLSRIRNHTLRIPRISIIVIILLLLLFLPFFNHFIKFSPYHLTLSVQQYQVKIKPVSPLMQKFLIEKKVTIDKKKFTKNSIKYLNSKKLTDKEQKEKLNKTKNQITNIGQPDNIYSVITLQEEIEGKSKGFAWKEVSVSLLYLTKSMSEQLKHQLNLNFSESIFFHEIICEGRCSEIAVELVDFPQGAFYEAKDPSNFKKSSYLNAETLRWSNRDLEEIQFAFIPPPYNNFEKLIRLFSWFDSAEKYLLVFLGACFALFFMPRVENLFRKTQPNIAIAIAGSKSMSGDRHINTGGGNYIESNTGTYIQGNYISMSQDLAHAAAQIQELIEQLQQQGVTVDVAQEQVARDMATQAQTSSTVKDKLLKWGQSLGDAAVSDVVKGVVKLAIRSAGIPLP